MNTCYSRLSLQMPPLLCRAGAMARSNNCKYHAMLQGQLVPLENVSQ